MSDLEVYDVMSTLMRKGLVEYFEIDGKPHWKVSKEGEALAELLGLRDIHHDDKHRS